MKICIALIILSLSMSGFAQSNQKIIHKYAFLVGNKDYRADPKLRPLISPAKDAGDMAIMLKNAGFEIYDENNIVNIEGRNLKIAAEAFSDKVKSVRRDIMIRNAVNEESIVALFFFSGHGFMDRGSAYLAGIDASGEYVEDLEARSLKVDKLISDLDASDQEVEMLSVLLIDACRTNLTMPSRQLASQKSVALGGKELYDRIRGSGLLAVFATLNGHPSFDGRKDTENSVFTAALLAAAKQPDGPTSFDDYLHRVKRLTPYISYDRFKVKQDLSIFDAGVSFDIPWNQEQVTNLHNIVSAANAKGAQGGSEGWIWIGEYSRAEYNPGWIRARFSIEGKSEVPRPEDIAEGQMLELHSMLNVRQNFPTRDADCKGKTQECVKYLGSLPNGLKVKILSGPKALGNEQWIRVGFDPELLKQLSYVK